jgi:hypothetical protein
MSYYDNETVYKSGTGWAIRTFTMDGEKLTQCFEMPSEKGWVTDLVIWTCTGYMTLHMIAIILNKMRDQKPRGNHPEGTVHYD